MNRLIRWGWRNTISVAMHGTLVLVSMAALAQEPNDTANSETQTDASLETQVAAPPESQADTLLEAQTEVPLESQADNPLEPQTKVSLATQKPITIEQIVVTAERSYFALNKQIKVAKNRLYSEYNDLNELDEFDVDCKDPGWTHTRIASEACWPVFFERAVAQNSADAMLGLDVLIPVGQLELQYRKKFEELRANIALVANENPSAGEALMELGRLEAALRSKKEECMEQPAVLFFFRLCR